MQHFFSSLAVIEQLITTLNTSGIRHICPICDKSDQWISHGYLYKKPGERVGKRILCGKRYGKSGCGHTQALYMDDVMGTASLCRKHLSADMVIIIGARQAIVV